jgi:LysM repeat protein
MENTEPKITETIATPEITTAVELEPKTGHNFIHSKISLLVLILAAVATVALVFAVINKNDNTTTNPTVVKNVDTTAYIQSNLLLATPIATNGAYTSNVDITTGSDKVNGVDIRLSYDPKILTNVDIKPGTFFTKPPVILLKQIDQVKGEILYTVAINPSEKSETGKGTVAVISFSAIATTSATETQINFLPETEVTAIGHASTVLKTAKNLTFIPNQTQ